MLDLKKAFDKVNVYKLLLTLLDKNVHCDIINVLENWFTKSSCCIKWNNAFSNTVHLTSGVKQGGILSPLFFSLYVDILLERLAESNVGCYVNFNCMNSFMYADDLILLSISLTDLQRLFNLCVEKFDDLDLPVNINKCHCMRIGARYKSEAKAVSICNHDLQWVDSIVYLGVRIQSQSVFSCNWHEAKVKFYQSSNSILGKLGTNCSIDVLLTLINSHGLQNLLYAIAAMDLSARTLNSLNYAYNSVFAKIFRIRNPDIISQCQFFSGSLNFTLLYEMRRFCYLQKLIKCNRLSKCSDVDKSDFRSYCTIKAKYMLNDADSSKIVKRKIWDHFGNIVGLV